MAGLLIFPAIISSISFHYFAPAIVVAIYKMRPIRALWFALLSGLALDLFDNSLKFGLQSLNHTLAAAVLLRFKSYFFSDTLSTLPIMSALFGCFSTLFFTLFLYLNERPFSLSELIIKASFLYPLLEGSLNFCLFCLPVLVFGKSRPSGTEYFASWRHHLQKKCARNLFAKL